MATVQHPLAKPEVATPRQGSVRGLVVLAGVLLLVLVVSLLVGSGEVRVSRAIDVLLHPDGSGDDTIVRGLRVKRGLVAIVVGVSLGIAGALMQGHTRNPLADPGLLGVTEGASVAVVIGIYAVGISSPVNYAWFALVGAGLASALVFVIGTTKGGPDPVTLVLAGTAVGALLGSVTETLLLRDVTTLDDYRFWVVGSVNGPGLDVVAQVGPFLLVGLVVAAVGVPGLNMLQLGDDVARSLGLDPTRHKVLGVLAIMLLAGGATAICGPIAFVGLVVPHVARFLGGVDYRWVVPYAGLVGAIFVLLADVVGRVIVPPGEMQAGLVMALFGAPVFIVLVRRMKLVRL